MANWIVVTTVAAKPVTIGVNLDLVKIIQPGQLQHTISLDGNLVAGDFETLMLALDHTVFTG